MSEKINDLIKSVEALVYYSQIYTVKGVSPVNMPDHESAWKAAQQWIWDNCKANEMGNYSLKTQPNPGAVWVKASEVEIKPMKMYFAEYSGKDGLRYVGTAFLELDNISFYSHVLGKSTIKKGSEESDRLLLMPIPNESPAEQPVKPYDDLYRLVFSNLAKLRARTQDNERMISMADNIREIIEDVTNKMQAMPQPDRINDPWRLRQSEAEPFNPELFQVMQDAEKTKEEDATEVMKEIGEQSAISQDAHEKEVMMQAFDKVRKIFEGRTWIMEGRGAYPYNDFRYREEVRYMYDEFDQLFKDTWGNIKSKSIEYREWIIAEYLQKDHPAIHDILKRLGYSKAAEQPGREVINIDELWDEHSELIDDDIDTLSRWAGSTVVDKEQFRTIVAQLWEVFKKEKL